MDLGAKFLVGTSGYSFPDWVGTFYPPGTRAKEMFAFYLQHFRTVEVNYTFYRMPSAATLDAMARQTPPEFTFWVKAHQSITHEHELGAAKEFLEALGPMQAAGNWPECSFSIRRVFTGRSPTAARFKGRSMPSRPCRETLAS